MTEQVKKPVRKKPTFVRMQTATKKESFAIGVTPEHYWFVSGIASGTNKARTKTLEEVIDFYIKHAIAKEKL